MTDTRKLAAILAADVVGYSRLAGADEERTLARLRALRSDLIDPTIAIHHGRVVKRTGDGILVEFRSVVDAVRCAIEIQNGMVERNAGVPSGRRIEFRCGVHLGDIVEEADGDLMGDGVNIAARLEGIAPPGAICLSEDAYRQVKTRLELAVSDLGAKRLKNIIGPVRVYALQVGKSSRRSTGYWLTLRVLKWPLAAAGLALLAGGAGGAWYLLHRPPSAIAVGKGHLSIVVLPFASLSGDPGQDYFADGMTEQIATALSRLRGSIVIAQSTAMTYKGKHVDFKEIGQSLGVRYVLRGAVQRDGQEVRVNAQLIGTERGRQLWADRFDGNMVSLFKLQDDIVVRLSRALQIELVRVESRRAETRQNPDAINLAMRGWSTMQRTPSRENNVVARALFQRAIDIDSSNPDATAGLAYVGLRDHINGWTQPGQGDDIQDAMRKAEQAIKLDPNYAYPYYIKADLLAYTMTPMDQQTANEALATLKTALYLNPSLAPSYYVMAVVEEMMGEYERAISHIQQAMQLSPRDFLLGPWLARRGRNHFGLRQYDAAIQDELASLNAGYHTFQPLLALAGAYAASGDDEKAKNVMTGLLHASPHLSVAWFQSHLPSLIEWPPGMLESLRKAGLPEH
ncbi:adenylate/guanylate cyclase domain-containing protein [Bradyrhizobium sp. USDA 4502]